MDITLAKKPAYTTILSFSAKNASKDLPDFEGKAGEVTVRYTGKITTIYCGLGPHEKVTTGIIRSSAAKGIQMALELKRNRVSLIPPSVNLSGHGSTIAALEGALLGGYSFSKYKSEKPFTLETIECIDPDLPKDRLHSTMQICSSVMYARDLVNENASIVTPEFLAEEARTIGKSARMHITILTEKEIKKQNLGLLFAVGQGSPTPPRLIIMEYRGNPSSKKRTALVGKGITFDSGGQNLKPTGHIETMRLDMAGAAAVLGTMQAIAALKLKANVIGVIAAAHNAIGHTAFFPGDIYTSYAKKTVEVLSTDAEGRLVLADAIAYCIDHFKPTKIIDLATLTGGILTSLSDLIAGLFSNDDDLANSLFAAGERTGERLWRFPLYQEFRDSLKSDCADLRNLSKLKKGYASSITGAAFIQEFVDDCAWAHLDIAGTAFNEGGARGEVPQYATGFGVRLLVDFLENS